MYGENYGTGTLARLLRNIAKRLYYAMDDGTDWADLIDDARQLMEGSIVLWESLMEEAVQDDR